MREPPATTKPPKETPAPNRADRLAEALRANLARRKARARARAAADGDANDNDKNED